MIPHTFNVDGMQFVSGLFWQPLAGGNSTERAKEIRALAKELSFDLYVLRTTTAHCVGFVSAAYKLRPGILSAAAVVSKTLEVESGLRDFIFVSQLPDSHWIYVAQRDGVILPDGDQSFASEDEAKSRLLEDMSLGEWQTVIAPEIWGIQNSIEREFAPMLPRKESGKRQLHRWWRLVPVDSRKAFFLHSGKIVLAGVLALAVAGGYGYKLWQEKKAREEAEALAALQRSMPPPPPEHPWKKIPRAAELLTSCMETFSSTPLFPGNWDVSLVNCRNGSFTVSWTPQKHGWIAHLKAVEPRAVISLDGSMASLTIPLKTLVVGFDEPVQTQNARLVEMYAAAQRYGVKFTAKPPPPPPPPLPGQANENIPKPDWAEIGWKAEGVDFPDAVLAALDGAGFRMTGMSATWTDGKFVWTMEGTQYVQP